MSRVRNVEKNLALLPDIVVGRKTVQQRRRGVMVEGKAIDLPYPIQSFSELAAVDTTKYDRARLYYDNTSYIEYLFDGTWTKVYNTPLTLSELVASATGLPVGSELKVTSDSPQGKTSVWKKSTETAPISSFPDSLGKLAASDAEGNVWELMHSNTVAISLVNGSVKACEGATGIRVDLEGLDVNTPLEAINNDYFNGRVVTSSEKVVPIEAKQLLGEADYSIARPRTKSPELDWEGKDVLWLGTSIPAQGGSDSYPAQFGAMLGCRVANNAWAGSHAGYSIDGDPFERSTITALSMTQADVDWGLATYGPGSAYDYDFDPITKAVEMTAEFRIKKAFELSAKDVVMLDHNHNDRFRALGTLEPEQLTVTAVSLGSVTSVTMLDASSVTVGMGATILAPGSSADYITGRVDSVIGNEVEIAFDSTGYEDDFTLGSLVVLDRSAIYDSWNFLIYYIKHMSRVFGNNNVKIVLCGAPSEHTNDVEEDMGIWRIAEAIKVIAAHWDLSFFDIGFLYDVKKHDHITYFPDAVHPTTEASRKALANYWVSWASGGYMRDDKSAKTLKGSGGPYTNYREALYDDSVKGFRTPDRIFTRIATVLSDDFTDLSNWVQLGTQPATIEPVPWPGIGNAVKLSVDTSSYARLQHNIAPVNHVEVTFDWSAPVVDGLVTPDNPVGSIALLDIMSSGAYFTLQGVAKTNSLALRPLYFKSPNTGLVNLDALPDNVIAGQKYSFKIVVRKASSLEAKDGEMQVWLDNVLVLAYANLDNFAQNDIAKVRLNSSSPNVDAFSHYFANFTISTEESHDYTQRYTGTVTAGTTMNVVNGLIVSVTP